jgi:hypothetical protein
MKLLFFVLSLTLLLSGCGSSSSNSSKKTNKLSLNNVKTNSTVTLKLNETNSIKSYSWWSQDGGILGHTPSVKWTAPSKSGRYTVTVDTVDQTNEKSTSSIVINVVDDLSKVNKPTITLNGNSTLEIEVGSNYSELGASANDKEDGDLTDKIIIDGDVDVANIGTYTITYSVVDSDGNRVETKRVLKVLQPTFQGEFAEIKQLLQDSKDGLVSDVTYICVGDSTRAVNEDTHAEHLFNTISARLDNYNVKSILKARGSHTLKQFLDESNTPTISDVIKNIPGNGSTTILDMSLGYNDFPYDIFDDNSVPNPSDREIIDMIKERLIEAIDKILRAKPNTHIYLTSPNPNFSWSRPTEDVQQAYREVAEEKDLPFVDFVSNIMKGSVSYDNKPEYVKWYIHLENGAYDQVHFSTYGLDKIANYIFSKILS